MRYLILLAGLAVPSDEARVRDAVSRAMAAKYGHIDRVLLMLRDHSRSVPIRLEPRPPQHAQSVREHAAGVSP